VVIFAKRSQCHTSQQPVKFVWGDTFCPNKDLSDGIIQPCDQNAPDDLTRRVPLYSTTGMFAWGRPSTWSENIFDFVSPWYQWRFMSHTASVLEQVKRFHSNHTRKMDCLALNPSSNVWSFSLLRSLSGGGRLAVSVKSWPHNC